MCKNYDSPETALKRENSHSLCYCKKQTFFRLHYSVIGYGKSVFASINFEHRHIKVGINDDDHVRNLKVTDVNYCPFCGELLEVENE